MILLLVSLWAAGAAVPTDTLSPHPAVHRDTGPPGTVAVHRQPALPMVSLRLSLLADDPLGYAGAGHFQQHLVFPTLREEAARVGGHAQVTRTADALVYTVTGPAAELTYLARVLRSALAVPASGQGQMLAAARDLAEERNAEWETAPQHVRARLRGRLFPWQLPAAGTHSSALRLDLASVRAAWAAMYRPERVAVVAVGDVQRRAVEAAFASLPGASGASIEGGLQDTVPLTPPTPAEATRGWLGIGWGTSDLDPATVSVAARLLRDEVQRALPTASVEAEHWWTHGGQALVVVVGLPGAQMPAARRQLAAAAGGLAGRVSDAAVRDAATRVRQELLFYARTPDRMAELIGSFVDRGGDAAGADRFHAAVAAVRADDVRAALRHLAEGAPVQVDLPPQRLTPNR